MQYCLKVSSLIPGFYIKISIKTSPQTLATEYGNKVIIYLNSSTSHKCIAKKQSIFIFSQCFLKHILHFSLLTHARTAYFINHQFCVRRGHLLLTKYFNRPYYLVNYFTHWCFFIIFVYHSHTIPLKYQYSQFSWYLKRRGTKINKPQQIIDIQTFCQSVIWLCSMNDIWQNKIKMGGSTGRLSNQRESFS